MATRLGLCGVFLAALVALPSHAAEKLVLVAGGDRGGELRGPFGVDADRAGNLFIVEISGHRVLKVDGKGTLSTVAGTGQKGDGGDGGPGAKATFNGMHNLAVAANGDLYLADTWNNRVRKIDSKTGVITPLAGTGQKGFGGDGGLALKAQFGGVYCVALDPKGEYLYVADLDNRRIRAIDLKTNVVRTVAGNGQKGIPQDGATATEAPLVDPRAVAVDATGNVYVLERSGHALRVVSPDGKIRTVVGTGKAGAAGDGGDALKASLNGPKHLCVDAQGNVLIADAENHLIRKYVPKEGKIVRVAGTGKRGSTGVGGDPLRAELSRPHGVFVHATGAIYIVDSDNHRILKIDS
jgi:DNA-binding beta-propeller fold protein YncE